MVLQLQIQITLFSKITSLPEIRMLELVSIVIMVAPQSPIAKSQMGVQACTFLIVETVLIFLIILSQVITWV